MIKRYLNPALHPVDLALAGYALTTGLLLLPFHHGVLVWVGLAVANIGLGFFILEFARFTGKATSPFLHVLRVAYIPSVMYFFWNEMNLLVRMIFPFYGTAHIIHLDEWIFGGHPTVMVMHLFNPTLTEIMHFFYASYYSLFPLLLTYAYIKNKEKGALDFAFYVCFIHVICYLIFIIFPVEGPRTALAAYHTQPHIGGFFLALIHQIQATGSILGGAFPSAHVSAAFIMTFFTMKYNRPLGGFLLLLSTGIALATVYCQYHHAVDGIAGFLLSIPVYFTARRILNHWQLQ